jgi:hypothetical protein
MVALRTIHEIFSADQDALTAVVTFNGHVPIKDQATGQPVRPCLINVSAKREQFATFVHADLDPVVYLRKLNALVSLRPYDLEAVGPVVNGRGHPWLAAQASCGAPSQAQLPQYIASTATTAAIVVVAAGRESGS